MESPLDDFLLELSKDSYLTNIKKYLPSAWIGHAPFLKFIIREQKPLTYVELGVHNGFSFFVACQAIQELNLDTKSFAIDHWEGDNQAGIFDDSVYEAFANINSQFSQFSTIKKMRFKDAASDFSDSSIDLLHIDGFHTYESVKEDFETWIPKMKDDGIVLMHDIFVRRETFGVYKLWKEIKSVYKSLEFTNSHGLGVVFIGEIPGKVKKIFEWANSGYLADIQGAFGSLTDDVIQRYGTNNRSELEFIGDKLKSAEKDLLEREIQLNHLEHELFLHKEYLSSVVNSRSWKITSPYRKFRRFFN